MDPRRRPGSSGRGWLGTGESGGTGVHFSLMYNKKVCSDVEYGSIEHSMDPRRHLAVKGEVGLEQEGLGALECILH